MGHQLILCSAMDTIRSTYKLGRFVTVNVKDYGHGNVEIVFQQSVYVSNFRSGDKPVIKEFALTLQQWQQLMDRLQDIEKAVTDHKTAKMVQFRYHLGRNRYVQVNSGFKVVDLRVFWLPEGKSDVQPTRRGISLKFEEFDSLVKLKAEIEQVIPELNTIQPCWMGSDHMNQLGALSCSECNPNDHYNW